MRSGLRLILRYYPCTKHVSRGFQFLTLPPNSHHCVAGSQPDPPCIHSYIKGPTVNAQSLMMFTRWITTVLNLYAHTCALCVRESTAHSRHPFIPRVTPLIDGNLIWSCFTILNWINIQLKSCVIYIICDFTSALLAITIPSSYMAVSDISAWSFYTPLVSRRLNCLCNIAVVANCRRSCI